MTSLHYTARTDAARSGCPAPYAGASRGHTRAPLLDERTGALHLGMTLCTLAPSGTVDLHLHAFEETFFVLHGDLDVTVDGRAHRLTPGDYGLAPVGTPHGWRNGGDAPARWVEVATPRPRRPDELPDTAFVAGRDDAQPATPAGDHAPSELVGRFDGRPRGGLSRAGLGADVPGIGIEMLVDRAFGAAQANLFVVEYEPGVELALHDHPFEEAYLFLSGSVEALLDGERLLLGAGDVLWAGVGSVHGFANRGSDRVRWLEVQAPQPPARNATRFKAAWEQAAEDATRPPARRRSRP